MKFDYSEFDINKGSPVIYNACTNEILLAMYFEPLNRFSIITKDKFEDAYSCNGIDAKSLNEYIENLDYLIVIGYY